MLKTINKKIKKVKKNQLKSQEKIKNKKNLVSLIFKCFTLRWKQHNRQMLRLRLQSSGIMSNLPWLILTKCHVSALFLFGDSNKRLGRYKPMPGVLKLGRMLKDSAGCYKARPGV